ncbi:hypothetical protein C0J52_23147, partial [Blattella germanica]
ATQIEILFGESFITELKLYSSFKKNLFVCSCTDLRICLECLLYYSLYFITFAQLHTQTFYAFLYILFIGLNINITYRFAVARAAGLVFPRKKVHIKFTISKNRDNGSTWGYF